MRKNWMMQRKKGKITKPKNTETKHTKRYKWYGREGHAKRREHNGYLVYCFLSQLIPHSLISENKNRNIRC
jgi:hypothetical protein